MTLQVCADLNIIIHNDTNAQASTMKSTRRSPPPPQSTTSKESRKDEYSIVSTVNFTLRITSFFFYVLHFHYSKYSMLAYMTVPHKTCLATRPGRRIWAILLQSCSCYMAQIWFHWWSSWGGKCPSTLDAICNPCVFYVIPLPLSPKVNASFPV